MTELLLNVVEHLIARNTPNGGSWDIEIYGYHPPEPRMGDYFAPLTGIVHDFEIDENGNLTRVEIQYESFQGRRVSSPARVWLSREELLSPDYKTRREHALEEVRKKEEQRAEEEQRKKKRYEAAMRLKNRLKI